MTNDARYRFGSEKSEMQTNWTFFRRTDAEGPQLRATTVGSPLKFDHAAEYSEAEIRRMATEADGDGNPEIGLVG